MEERFTKILYFIISCQDNINLYKENISIEIKSNQGKILESENIIIRNREAKYLNVKEINNSFTGKNIYLYKIKLELKRNNIDMYIKLIFNKDKLKSKKPFQLIKDIYHSFIYSIEFEAENFFELHFYFSTDTTNFIENKFKINKLQKFLIFKEYINTHETSEVSKYLLQCTANQISNKSVDYELLLNFLIYLLKFNKKYSALSQDEELIFQSVICNFISIETIIIKQYGIKDYDKIIETCENYKKEIQDEKTILNLDCFILWFYQTNKRNLFKKFFQTVTFKNEVANYMMKYANNFTNYNSSELEMIYQNGNISIPFLIKLSINFNEYIKFFCNHAKEISDNNIDIDLKNCPIPDENYEYDILKMFIENTINNKKLHFPSK